MEHYRLVFSGSGGQGVITAAIILAEAASLYEDRNAVQSQSYGPEARGGATRSDVIISDKKINFPKVIQPNILVCLTQEAYNKYASIVLPGGLLITDERFVKTERKIDARQIEKPMYSNVMEKIGKPIVFNICMLGTLIGFTEIVQPESVLKTLENKIPPAFLEMNREALQLGIDLAKGNS
jgi:2-oxoglutarate ferredoxin oxidoreductase subunit gamma